jgi:hypothetical protein
MPARSNVRVLKSFFGKGVDGSGHPIGVASVFYGPKNSIIYFYNMEGMIPGRTAVIVKWYRDGAFWKNGCAHTAKHGSDAFYCPNREIIGEGTYVAQIESDGNVVSRAAFRVAGNSSAGANPSSDPMGHGN